jgi:glycosyltransferase involved in cell wall biosynthesis
MPLVSALICSYNAERFLDATLQSVMSQTYRNLEILVLDNASSDGTLRILEYLGGRDPRLQFFRAKENLGAYGGLNYLLGRAKGSYIAIQDHDDLWYPDKIARQVAFLEENDGFVGSGTAILNYYEKHDLFMLRRQPEVFTLAWHTSLVFRSSGKLYDTSMKAGNDFHFMKNILCENRPVIRNFREPMVIRSVRADNTNLSSRWIGGVDVSDVIGLQIPLKDKLSLLLRMTAGNAFVEYLILRLVLRGRVLSKAAVEGDPVLRRFRNRHKNADPP